MAKESCCRAAGKHRFARSIGVPTFHLGRAAALGVAHLHVAHVDDSFQLGYALEEIQHRIANSLQIIAGIILMKANTVSSEETRTFLQDTNDRVI